MRSIAIDPNAFLYYKSALALFLPVKAREDLEAFMLTFNKTQYFFCHAETSFNSATSTRINEHKFISNRILEVAGIPVPKAVLVEAEEFANNSFLHSIKHLKFPLVIKPYNESKGTDVLCNIQTLDELKLALNQVFPTYDGVIVEEFHAKLNSYRVLVFNQRILGVILRHPAHVIGDGEHTIEELIALTNIQRQKTSTFLGMITLDVEAHTCLKEQGVTIDYIPQVGKKIDLGYTSNATRGGTYETINKKLCKKNRKLMIRAAKALDLKYVGIDLQCVDIVNKPIEYPSGVIIETNCRPSVRIHELPMYGPPKLVTRKVMRYFIYRHPFAYINSLYSNKKTTFYVRSFIVTIILACLYLLLIKGVI